MRVLLSAVIGVVAIYFAQGFLMNIPAWLLPDGFVFRNEIAMRVAKIVLNSSAVFLAAYIAARIAKSHEIVLAIFVGGFFEAVTIYLLLNAYDDAIPFSAQAFLYSQAIFAVLTAFFAGAFVRRKRLKREAEADHKKILDTF